MLQSWGHRESDMTQRLNNSHPSLQTGETGLTVCGNCSWCNTATLKSNRSTRWGSTWEYLYEKLFCGLVCAKLLQLCLTLSDSMDGSPEGPSFFCPWDSPNKNTGVGCCALFPGDLPEQEGSNLYLLCLRHWQAGFLPLALAGESPQNHEIHDIFILFLA